MPALTPGLLSLRGELEIGDYLDEGVNAVHDFEEIRLNLLQALATLWLFKVLLRIHILCLAPLLHIRVCIGRFLLDKEVLGLDGTTNRARVTWGRWYVSYIRSLGSSDFYLVVVAFPVSCIAWNVVFIWQEPYIASFFYGFVVLSAVFWTFFPWSYPFLPNFLLRLHSGDTTFFFSVRGVWWQPFYHTNVQTLLLYAGAETSVGMLIPLPIQSPSLSPGPWYP